MVLALTRIVIKTFGRGWISQ